MPQPLPPQTDELLRDMQAQIRDQETRLDQLESRRRLDLPRGLTENIPAPGEGEVVVRADSDRPWYYANGEWRPFAAPVLSYKVFADAGMGLASSVTVVSTGDGKLIRGVPDWLDGYQLVAVHAYVTTASSSGAVTVMVRNVTQAADMLSTAITIDSGDLDSEDAAVAAAIDAGAAQVTAADQIAVDIDGAGTGAKGLGVDLLFGRLP